MQQNRAAQVFLFTFEHNDQLCKQMWLLLEKNRHNWAPEMAPQSELQFGTPNCVSLHFRRRKPKSGARFGARTRTAFWDPFPAGKLRRQQSSLFRLFFWINVQKGSEVWIGLACPWLPLQDKCTFLASGRKFLLQIRSHVAARSTYYFKF